MNEIQIYNKNQLSLKETAWDSLSEASRKAYQSDFDAFFSFINKPAKDINSNDILSYIEHLKSMDRKNRTINRKISSLSKMFNVLKISGEIDENPVDILRKFKNINFKFEKSKKIPINISDINKMKFNSPSEERTLAIINFMASTGFRITELIDIKKEDVKQYDSDKMIVTIRHGKGGKQRTQYLRNERYEYLKTLFPDKEEMEYFFYNSYGNKYNRTVLWKQITELTKKNLGRKINPHMFRHFYGTHQINIEKRDIKAVSLSMGHSNVSITLDFYVDTALDPDDAIIDIGGK